MTAANKTERHFIEKGIVARDAGASGWGLFADQDFEPGSLIFWLELKPGTRSTIGTWEQGFGPCQERGFTFLPDFSFCCSEDIPFWFVNHICDPNAGFVNWGYAEEQGIPFVAHRHIAKGEQITSEYSVMTTSYDGSLDRGPWSMSPCLCGLPNCRGTITSFNALDEKLMRKFVLPDNNVRGRVLAHVLSERPDMVELLRREDPTMYAKYQATLKQQAELSQKLRLQGHL